MTRSAQWLYGWLLLLPAMALLALFTHYPAVATLWHDRAQRWEKAILNTARVGWFSSDRAVGE
mgnify:CR=1 FL=1